MLNINISGPTNKKPAKLTEKDVWGDFENDRGMRVAISGERCPVFKDIIPHKSCTVICNKEQEDEVVYWLEYVYGQCCVIEALEIDDSNIAMRAEYQCW